MKDREYNKEFQEIFETKTREEFKKEYYIGMAMGERESSLLNKADDEFKVSCPVIEGCPYDTEDCTVCWETMLQETKFKDVKGMEIINEQFEKIIRTHTRKEFEEKYKVEECLYNIDSDYEEVCCPFDDEGCPDGISCSECWQAGVKIAKFKDEVGEAKILIRSPEMVSQATIICTPRGLQDPYLNEDRVFERLVKEYKEHGSLIIAYDFDSTVSDPRNQGCTYDRIIDLLRRWEGKARFICFTCRTPDRYVGVMKYLIDNNIPVDRINEGFEGVPNGIQKPYYNAFLDDRAGLCETYNVLNRVLNEISK